MLIQRYLSFAVAAAQALQITDAKSSCDSSHTRQHRRLGQSLRTGQDQFLIQSHQADRLCLAANQTEALNGARVRVEACQPDSLSQAWSLVDKTLRLKTGQCLDVTDGRRARGTLLQMWDCDKENKNQKFVFSQDTIVWQGHDRCLSFSGNASSQVSGKHLVRLEACDDSTNTMGWSKRLLDRDPSKSSSRTRQASATRVSATPSTSTKTTTSLAIQTAPTPTKITCPTLENWSIEQQQFEIEALRLINQARARGADCGTRGSFAKQKPLVSRKDVVCLARGFAKDMADNHYFSHTDRFGQSPFDRMSAAEISYSRAAENIAEGYQTPQAVVQGWLESDGHCANLMGPYVYSGIGVNRNVWVQDFIAP